MALPHTVPVAGGHQTEVGSLTRQHGAEGSELSDLVLVQTGEDGLRVKFHVKQPTAGAGGPGG